MTTLAADKARKFENVNQQVQNSLPIIAADTIFCGALVGDNGSGYARPLVAGDSFWGICVDQCENEDGSAGAKFVNVLSECYIVVAVIGASAVTDVDSTVYAADDNTFTLSSTSNSTVGIVHRWVSSTTCVVHCQAISERSI